MKYIEIALFGYLMCKLVPMLLAANRMLTMYFRQKEGRNNKVYLGFGFLMGTAADLYLYFDNRSIAEYRASD